MYMELTPMDTNKDLQNLLINAIPSFEFPRKNLYDYTIETSWVDENSITSNDFVLEKDMEQEPPKYLVDNSKFNIDLTLEEINILAILMVEGWLQRQLTTVEVVRMKYSGSDFKFTSQANHLAKLQNLLTEIQRQSLHAQRLYKRRKFAENGVYVSNWSSLVGKSALDH